MRIHLTTFVNPSMSAIINIFDVATFSVHDGPGVRVVVYFQGCVARCEWCHSPQSQLSKAPLTYNPNLCAGCRRCGDCPNGVHTFDLDRHRVERSSCTQCGKCIELCPHSIEGVKGSSLHLPTSSLPVSSLFEQIAPYMRLSEASGGITLSGGEALLQAKAARELLSLCRQNGFHTTVETSGLLPVKMYREFAPLVDLWLFGMRVITGKDHARHDKHIGQVLEQLSLAGAHILPRIPMVPGFFDRTDVLESITGLLRKYGIDTVCLNPWNVNYDVHYLQAGLPLRMPAPSLPEVEACEATIYSTLAQFKFNIYENDGIAK